MNKFFLALLTLVATLSTPAFSQGPVPPATGARAPGLYVQVLDGLIHVTNPAGSSNFSAGQFGYTASITQPPVIVPKNPGIQFTLPPAFTVATGPNTPGGTASKPGAVDCEVR